MSTEITKKDKVFFILKNIGIGLYILLLFMFLMKSPLTQMLHQTVKRTQKLFPKKKIQTTNRECFLLFVFYIIISIFILQFIFYESNWIRVIYILLECLVTFLMILITYRTIKQSTRIRKLFVKNKMV